MTSKLTDQINRRVIPRWRESSTVAKSGELAPLKERSTLISFDRELARLKAELRNTPLPGIAADALGIAILAGDSDLAAKAKDVLRKHETIVPHHLKSVIGSVADTVESAEESGHWDCVTEQHKMTVRRIRQLLQQYPNNPILYLDLARSQAVLGESKKAERSILAALTLAPNHRHVLRAAARFFISEFETHRAHKLLSTSPVSAHDPWLMASEVATAQFAGKAPKFFKAGKQFLERRAIKPIHLSELAAAIGTVELSEGRKKDAKRQFELAMLDPTENSLAQVKWAENKINTHIAAGKPCLDISGAHEAAFIKAYYHNHDILGAMTHVAKWFSDEPFSDVAAMMHSYMGSLLDDYQSVIDVCNLGLRTHPLHQCLMNNKIFAELSSGQVFQGEDDVVSGRVFEIVRYLRTEVNREDADVPHIVANSGLLLYRLGYADEGKKAYDQALVWAKRKGEFFSAANALLYHTREAILARTEWADQLLQETTDVINKAQVSSSGQRFYLEKLKALAAAPEKAGEILNPSAAKAYLPKREKPKEGLDFTVTKNADGTVTLTLPKRLRPIR